ncbi:hypothetical protein UlMin_007044 [Ulmus minor]
MYQDLKRLFWWPGMKKDVVKYVEKCLTCQKIKAEHQRPVEYNAIWVIIDRLMKTAHFLPIRITYSLEQLAEIYVWVIVCYQATIGMAPYEALYGRKCRSPIHWHETGEHKFMEPDFVAATTQAVKHIRERMKV